MDVCAEAIAPERILRFWHKVEFFIPFDLQRQVMDARDSKWSVHRYTDCQLRQSNVNDLWRFISPGNRRITGYDLYLGVFDTAELSGVVQQVSANAQNLNEELEQQERGAQDGLTCFARIGLNADGEPVWDDVSVSTVPWALGRIQQQGLGALDFDAFLRSEEALKHALANFHARRPANATTGSEEHAQPLAPQELTALLEVFYEWADYRPRQKDRDTLRVVIRAKSKKEDGQAGKTAVATASNGQTPPSQESAAVEEKEKDSEPVVEIDILNSFYAEDIAQSIRSLESGEPCPLLMAYLSPLPEDLRLDLYREAGRQRILDALFPSLLPAGHWLDEPHHAMSLMQQFAINSVFSQLEDGGIFSVNGPPGTGKTTLLRDIFAENITRRARVLAGFGMAREALMPSTVPVCFGEKTCRITPLRPELAGFEMVVASSNNAAVENLSRDLPKSSALGRTAWRNEAGCAQVGYLRPVARNVAARTSTGEYRVLDAGDDPWGLVAAALGRKSNRSAFAEGIGFSPKNLDALPSGADSETYQSVWDWRNHYTGPTFDEAKQVFFLAEERVRKRTAQLERFARLGERFGDLVSHTEWSRQGLEEAIETAQAVLTELEKEMAYCMHQLELLVREEQLIERGRPGWWVRWFSRSGRSTYRKYLEERASNRQEQLDMSRRKRAAEAQCQAGKEVVDELSEAHDLAQLFPETACPTKPEELEHERWQVDGLWRDEELNRLRSELFASALVLHEAWLAEVLKKGGGFGANVMAMSLLLSGKRPQDRAQALLVWQSLFMLVPVVSSTFASIARQFPDIGPNALGWLFIDEAGQAVPQAAVGALWRFKRAVVVGDPMQIEPVFTVPIKLIEALRRSSGLPPDSGMEPHRVSVQNLADAANPLGVDINTNGESQWIGSPLRVHRRCKDPMFSIANMIAYDGKMIMADRSGSGKKPPPSPGVDMGFTAWVDVKGQVLDKQTVPEQIELVHQALMLLYKRTGELPGVYIISPFRRIKESLIRQISRSEHWVTVSNPPASKKLKNWCKQRIGTVHTFQGKEEDMVWLVLGCDMKTRGAAQWAAGKPNLLNVALTRAKFRFFMIGDDELWGRLPYFNLADESRLPRITPEEFLRRVS